MESKTFKTVKVDQDTYRLIVDFAERVGLSIAGTIAYLVEKSRDQGEECRKLRERLNFFDKLEVEIKKRLTDKSRWNGWESLLGLLDEAAMYALDLERRLESYQSMFRCARCKKPLTWSPDDSLGKDLRAYVKRRGWHHGNCAENS